MGRFVYFSSGKEYKFWVGSQSSSDITKFGGNEDEKIYWNWSKEDVPLIEKKVEESKSNFLTDIGQSYDEFMEKRNAGDTYSAERLKMKAEVFEEACRKASFINLGLVILEELKEDDNVSAEAEC